MEVTVTRYLYLCLHRCRSCLLAACSPRSWLHRYVILCLICLVKVGVAYCYVMPAALERTIIQVMRVDTAQYELLYSFYSWPNVFLMAVGGVLLDKVLGLRVGLLVFLFLTCFGQLLFALGGFLDRYWLMVVGRFVFGVGGETGGAAAEVIATVLFRNKRLSFVFTVQFSTSLFTAAVSMSINRKIYKSLIDYLPNHHHRLGAVLVFGLSLCLFSLVLGVVVAALDYRSEGILRRKREVHRAFRLRDLKDFSLSFWLLNGSTLFFYMGMFPFLSIAPVFFEQKYAYQSAVVSVALGIALYLPAILFPFMGLLVDWTGNKVLWGISGVAGVLFTDALYAFTTGTAYFLPFLGSALYGLSYGLYNAAMWPLVFLLIQDHQLATAYGIVYSSYNLGQALSTIIVGLIVDSSGYLFVQLFFCSILSLSLLLTGGLYWVDITSGRGRLSMRRLKGQPGERKLERRSQQLQETAV